MAKRGRKSIRTEEMIDEILSQIACGKSLVKILKSDEKFPDYVNFLRWLDKDPELRRKYARAREDQADFLADEINDLSDEAAKLEKDGFDNARVQAYRLRIDSRKWSASKLRPKKYGDKLEVDAAPDLQKAFALPPLKQGE